MPVIRSQMATTTDLLIDYLQPQFSAVKEQLAAIQMDQQQLAAAIQMHQHKLAAIQMQQSVVPAALNHLQAQLSAVKEELGMGQQVPGESILFQQEPPVAPEAMVSPYFPQWSPHCLRSEEAMVSPWSEEAATAAWQMRGRPLPHHQPPTNVPALHASLLRGENPQVPLSPTDPLPDRVREEASIPYPEDWSRAGGHNDGDEDVGGLAETPCVSTGQSTPIRSDPTLWAPGGAPKLSLSPEATAFQPSRQVTGCVMIPPPPAMTPPRPPHSGEPIPPMTEPSHPGFVTCELPISPMAESWAENGAPAEGDDEPQMEDFESQHSPLAMGSGESPPGSPPDSQYPPLPPPLASARPPRPDEPSVKLTTTAAMISRPRGPLSPQGGEVHSKRTQSALKEGLSVSEVHSKLSLGKLKEGATLQVYGVVKTVEWKTWNDSYDQLVVVNIVHKDRPGSVFPVMCRYDKFGERRFATLKELAVGDTLSYKGKLKEGLHPKNWSLHAQDVTRLEFGYTTVRYLEEQYGQLSYRQISLDHVAPVRLRVVVTSVNRVHEHIFVNVVDKHPIKIVVHKKFYVHNENFQDVERINVGETIVVRGYPGKDGKNSLQISALTLSIASQLQ